MKTYALMRVMLENRPEMQLKQGIMCRMFDLGERKTQRRSATHERERVDGSSKERTLG